MKKIPNISVWEKRGKLEGPIVFPTSVEFKHDDVFSERGVSLRAAWQIPELGPAKDLKHGCSAHAKLTCIHTALQRHSHISDVAGNMFNTGRSTFPCLYHWIRRTSAADAPIHYGTWRNVCPPSPPKVMKVRSQWQRKASAGAR